MTDPTTALAELRHMAAKLAADARRLRLNQPECAGLRALADRAAAVRDGLTELAAVLREPAAAWPEGYADGHGVL